MERERSRPLTELVDEVHRQVAYVSGGVAALRASLSSPDFTGDGADQELSRLVATLQEIRSRLQEAARRLEARPLQTRLAASAAVPGLASLSPRQRRVLEDVVAGKTNKEIAYDIGVSEKTVETHRARGMAKLHARSLAQLVRISLGYEALGDGNAIRSAPVQATPRS